MARKRYISTAISKDPKLEDLAEHGTLPLLLYTWAIPHMDDWGRMSGDAREFRLEVCPGLAVTAKEVEQALIQIASVGLWTRYQVDGKWCLSIDPEPWFKHQSYISKDKRKDDSGSNYKKPPITEEHRETPQNTEDHQEQAAIAEIQQATAQIAASFSLSSSPSLSVSDSKDTTTTAISDEWNPFQFYENERFGFLSSKTGEMIGAMIDEYTEQWVLKAMEEAVFYNQKHLPYVKKVLEAWKLTGHPEPWTLPKKENQKKQANVTHLNHRRGGGRQKPSLPVVENTAGKALSDEERAELRRKAALLDANRNRADAAP